MLKAVKDTNDHLQKPRRRRLRTIAMLPTLLTLGNLYFGFMAVYFCGREMHDIGAGISANDVLTMGRRSIEALAPSFLSIAAWMLLSAMICDALDGRVARRTGRTSKFGAQMDSLADMVSFGVAPALMVMTMIRRELAQWGYAPFGFDQFGQAAVFISIIYVCCAALRLARFNVETSVDETAHQGFRGLPSPAAAAALVSLIFLHDRLDTSGGWQRTADVITKIMPLCTLTIGLLMVSRVPYVHAVSAFLRRRPFGHMVPVLLAFAMLLLYPEHLIVVAAWAFVASGPLRMILDKIKGTPLESQNDENQTNNSADEITRKQA
ncbi:MAG: CDP-diacylglycerol--serine O-phosphatidyltransferase [Planctomycetota bacterium]|nr:MAG: CDP-diacylglycerol--serine O-phosphatidyltransferase [Planctomycetota bacterium]